MSETPSPALSNLGQGSARESKSYRLGWGVQERTENLESLIKSISSSVIRNVTCLSFLISEMGRIILDSSLSQRNNNIINRHLATEKN